MTKSIFLLIFPIATFGQVDTNQIKILTKNYYEYIIADNGSFIRNCPDVEYDSIVVVYEEIFEYNYPYIQTPDKNLNKFMNDAVYEIVGRKNNSIERINLSWLCIDDKPAENYMDYKINFISSFFVSLTINMSSYAGRGGNGAGHYNMPLTFDLVNKKILTTTDVFSKNSYKLVYDILLEQFKTYTTNEIQLEYIKEADYLTWILNRPVAIFEDKIIFYQNVSYGGKSADGEIIFEFNKYPEIFNNKVIRQIMNK